MGLHGLDRHAGSTQSGEAGMAEFVASAMDESLNKAHVGGLARTSTRCAGEADRKVLVGKRTYTKMEIDRSG